MYKRQSKKSFERQIQKLNAEKRLTKRQKEWEYQRYLLQNRLAAAEKKGAVFAEDIIPEKPKRITQKSIEELKQIRGKKITARAIAILEKEPEKIRKKNVVDDEPIDVWFDYQPVEADYPQEEIEYPEINYTDTTDVETTPQETYYKENPEREYEPEVIADEGYNIIQNIWHEIGIQDYKLDQDVHPDILAVKYEGASQLAAYLQGAIDTYGEDVVARILQTKGSTVINTAIERVLYLLYKNSVDRTQTITDYGLAEIRDILFSNDTTASLRYDFND